MTTVQYRLDKDFKPYDVTTWYRRTEPGDIAVITLPNRACKVAANKIVHMGIPQARASIASGGILRHTLAIKDECLFLKSLSKASTKDV